MKLLILGDSHTNIYENNGTLFSNIFNEVRIHYCDSDNYKLTGQLKPILLNSIQKKGDIILGNYIKTYSNFDYIMLIFGEPDVRIHFHKQIHTLKRDEDEVINTLVTSLITKLKSFIPSNMKIIIRYILPPRESSMFNVDNNKYIPQGTLDERIRYTNKLNSALKYLSTENNIYFFDNIYKNELINQRGELADKYCDGQTHYNNNTLPILQKEIVDNFNIIFNST